MDVMIKIITTGGTIAEKPGKAGRFHLSGEQLIANLPNTRLASEIEVVDLMDVPSTFMRVEDMLKIADAAIKIQNDSNVAGVVVTHGTATMEETAYVADLIIPLGKPVVFTGAMLTPDNSDYDGITNLADAISLAASSNSYGKGVLVVMNGEIHAARDVVKAHATALDAFRSPEVGSLGCVRAGKPVYTRNPSKHRTIVVRPPIPEVCLMTCYAGINANLLQSLRSISPEGLVVAGMASGAVPPWLTDPLEGMVKDGIAVAVTTRCAEGSVVRKAPDRRRVSGYPEDLFARGLLPTPLPGLKARLKLALLLSAGVSGEALRHQMLQ